LQAIAICHDIVIRIVGAPAAVANTVFNATGKRVRDLPITPDKLI